MISIRNLDEPAPVQTEPIKQSNLFNTEPVIDPKPTPIITTDQGLDPIQQQAILAATLGAHVEITGSWVWAQFNTRPESSVLIQLKAHKWIWCKSKVKWAWRGAPCHSKKTMSWEYIVNKYGIKEIETKNKLVRI